MPRKLRVSLRQAMELADLPWDFAAGGESVGEDPCELNSGECVPFSASQEHSLASTLEEIPAAAVQWLTAHFEWAPQGENSRVLRSEVYKQFSKFCSNHNLGHIRHQSFTKLIKRVFPFVVCKRIGASLQSHYYYLGLKPKQPLDPRNNKAVLFTGSSSSTRESHSPKRKHSPTGINPPSVPTSDEAPSKRRKLESVASPWFELPQDGPKYFQPVVAPVSPVSLFHVALPQSATTGEPSAKEQHASFGSVTLPSWEPSYSLPTATVGIASASVPSAAIIRDFFFLFREYWQEVADCFMHLDTHGLSGVISGFWKSLPAHFVPVLECPITAAEIGEYDRQSYAQMIRAFFPLGCQERSVEALPTLVQCINIYIRELEHIMQTQPVTVRIVRMTFAKKFAADVGSKAKLFLIASAIAQALGDPVILGGIRGYMETLDTEELQLSAEKFGKGTTEAISRLKEGILSLLAHPQPSAYLWKWGEAITSASKGNPLAFKQAKLLMEQSFFLCGASKSLSQEISTSDPAVKLLLLFAGLHANIQ